MIATRPPRRHSSPVLFILASSILLAAAACGGGGTSSGSSGGGTPPPPTSANEWTWVSGSNQAGSSSTINGVYGTEGVAATTNVPPGRSYAVSWIDSSGNLWLFGGGGTDPLGKNGPFNDLWEFSTSSGEWAWVSGSSSVPGNQRGVYGTKGTASAANVPGGRSGAVSWTDSSGHLWLFGGGGYDAVGASGSLNDLWEFDPSSKEWTWMSGSSTVGNATGVYGTQGTPAPGNVPGPRSQAVSWIDNSGNLWLFGGQETNSSSGDLNDLWMFSPATKEWTWVGGSSTTSAKGVYGTVGVAASGNVPGARYNATSWTDGSGNLWLFGGFGYDASGQENDLNDLWEFSPSSKEWTWVSGSSTVTGNVCMPGVYGTEGTGASSNVPGGRNGAGSWADSSGNLWLFGGLGCDASGITGSLNDLWEFSIANKSWTWRSGSNSVGPAKGGTGGQSGIYGTEGVAAATNMPGGRSSAVTWIDSSGNLWLFGGVGLDSAGESGNLNDLWKFEP